VGWCGGAGVPPARHKHKPGAEGLALQARLDIPIACSLPSGELERRLAWIRRVTASSLLSHHRDGTVLRLQYRVEAMSELQQIVLRERECCPFLEFSLRLSTSAAHLTVHAPAGLGSDAQWLFDQFLPQAATPPRKSCGCAPGACGG
jgi:hypothetical protein